MKIVGIDPGVTGAVAYLLNGTVQRVSDMPVSVMTRGDGRLRRRIDPLALRIMVADAAPDLVIIEATWASPGMGVSSAYSFGHTAGTIEAVVALSVGVGCDVRFVTPQSWKRALGLPAAKGEATAMATRLLGGAVHWPLKRHHGRAEAALLAWYGWRLTGGAAAAGEPVSVSEEAVE
jgi:crossover junction endodeoxyribonuclease RuvC